MHPHNLIKNSIIPYSFQGQEHDDEVKGEGNSMNYKYRMCDPRIGRFFAVDPLVAKYPHNSSYAFSENRVIDALELEGLEKYLIRDITDENGTQLKVLTVSNIDAPFEVIDENGESRQDFKYCDFQSQMKNSEVTVQSDLNGGAPKKALFVPFLNQAEGERRKTYFDELVLDKLTGDRSVVNFNLTISDFTETNNLKRTQLSGYGLVGNGTYDPAFHGYGNLPFGTNRNFNALEVYLPTLAEQNQFKLDWIANKRDIEHGIKADDIIFLSAPNDPSHDFEINCLNIETCTD